MAILERIQRRATKMITALRQLSHEDRLEQGKSTTLETRMIRGDQTDVNKTHAQF